MRPTFHGQDAEATVETHVLDRTIDLYGRTIEVSFVARLREERKFPGIDALKAQILADVDGARRLLAPPSA